MDQSDDPRELERKIEQARRIASTITDQTTLERLRAWVEELKQSLRQRLAARRPRKRSKQALGSFESKTVGLQAATWSLASSRGRDYRARSSVTDRFSSRSSLTCP
jgi:hypothetical protein